MRIIDWSSDVCSSDLGVRLGGFLLLPDLTVAESFNSNIYATQNNPASDFITALSPKVDLRSDWGSHALNLHADSTLVRYTTHDSENYNDYTLATRSEEHTSELQSLMRISYAVFCLKKKI